MIDPEESLYEYQNQQDAPEPVFQITDDQRADWAVRKIVRRLGEIDANKKLAEIRRQQIDDWLDSVNQDADTEIKFFSEMLRPYLVERLAGQKTKTMKLPSGSVSLRHSNTEFTIDGEKIKTDNPDLLDYVRKTNPDYLKIKESVEWGEFKKTLIAMESGKVVTGDGEILGFMTAWQPPDNITVKGMMR